MPLDNTEIHPPFVFTITPSGLSDERKEAAKENWIRKRTNELFNEWKAKNPGSELSCEEVESKKWELLLAAYPTETSRMIEFIVLPEQGS